MEQNPAERPAVRMLVVVSMRSGVRAGSLMQTVDGRLGVSFQLFLRGRQSVAWKCSHQLVCPRQILRLEADFADAVGCRWMPGFELVGISTFLADIHFRLFDLLL